MFLHHVVEHNTFFSKILIADGAEEWSLSLRFRWRCVHLLNLVLGPPMKLPQVAQIVLPLFLLLFGLLIIRIIAADIVFAQTLLVGMIRTFVVFVFVFVVIFVCIFK